MDIKLLVKKRASFKCKLTQFKSYLESLQNVKLSRLQLTELNIRLSRIEEIYPEYDSLQNDIETMSETSDEQYADREAFESQYYKAIALARQQMERYQQRDGDESNSGSRTGSGTARRGGPKVKLPTIHLPTFSGNYHDWLEFHDTFNSLIHSDKSMPNISKFHYLRASLKDSAALVIRQLDFSADNYEVAWDLLCDRFNNKKLLVSNHIQAILNIDKLQKETHKGLRNLIDNMNKNLRALNTLKLPTEHWDVLIVHIISEKLDSSTSREWETHRSTLKELPTLKNFTEFIKNRADLLETIDEAQTKRRYSDVTHNRHKSFLVSSQSSLHKSFICPLCQSNHPIYRCTKF